jgi:hypothetical protein
MSEMGMLELEKIARAGYRAYLESCGGKSVHGEILPTWEEQRQEIRAYWRSAAREIAAATKVDLWEQIKAVFE